MEKYYWMRLSIKNEKTGKSDCYYYDLKDFIGRPSEWLPFVETSDVLDFLVEYKAKYIKEDEPMDFYLVCEKRIFPDDHNVDLAEVYNDKLYEGGDYDELCCVLSNLMEKNRTVENLEEMIDELVEKKEKKNQFTLMISWKDYAGDPRLTHLNAKDVFNKEKQEALYNNELAPFSRCLFTLRWMRVEDGKSLLIRHFSNSEIAYRDLQETANKFHDEEDLITYLKNEFKYEDEKEKELNSPPISFCIKCKGDFEFRKLEFDVSRVLQDFVDSRKGHLKLSSVVNTIALLDDAGTYQVEDFVIKAGSERHKELPKGENHFETIIGFFCEWYKELDKCDLDNYIEQRKATRKFIEKYVEENWFYFVIKV